MLRNDLILHLSQHDNDAVTVEVNGILIDVEQVSAERDGIVIRLNPDDLTETLQRIASGKFPVAPVAGKDDGSGGELR